MSRSRVREERRERHAREERAVTLAVLAETTVLDLETAVTVL